MMYQIRCSPDCPYDDCIILTNVDPNKEKKMIPTTLNSLAIVALAITVILQQIVVSGLIRKDKIHLKVATKTVNLLHKTVKVLEETVEESKITKGIVMGLMETLPRETLEVHPVLKRSLEAMDRGKKEKKKNR